MAGEAPMLRGTEGGGEGVPVARLLPLSHAQCPDGALLGLFTVALVSLAHLPAPWGSFVGFSHQCIPVRRSQQTSVERTGQLGAQEESEQMRGGRAQAVGGGEQRAGWLVGVRPCAMRWGCVGVAGAGSCPPSCP